LATNQAVLASGAREQRISGIRVAFTALAGTSIEWYDFFLYGTAAALVFPTVFFDQGLPPFVSLLASFSTFAVGFIARPIGGILFGHFGDRIGRKTALVTALVMMGVATTLIGCLPSYAIIGAAAPALLILLRFVQGLAIGGQWGGAVLLATECAPPNKRGLYGSFAQAGAPVGVILANLAFLLVSANTSQEDFLLWGWRIPFIASMLLVALAMYVQLRLEDSPAFEKVRATKAVTRPTESKSPVLDALRMYPKQIALAAGAFLAVQVTFYILIAFVVAYGTSPAHAGGRTDRCSCHGSRDIHLWGALGSVRSTGHLHGRRNTAGPVGLWALSLDRHRIAALDLSRARRWSDPGRDDVRPTSGLSRGNVQHSCALFRRLLGLSAWRDYRRRAGAVACNELAGEVRIFAGDLHLHRDRLRDYNGLGDSAP